MLSPTAGCCIFLAYYHAVHWASCGVQEYNMSKRFEHSFKSLSHDGSTISAVNPRAYANRFQDFMKKVFV